MWLFLYFASRCGPKLQKSILSDSGSGPGVGGESGPGRIWALDTVTVTGTRLSFRTKLDYIAVFLTATSPLPVAMCYDSWLVEYVNSDQERYIHI